LTFPLDPRAVGASADKKPGPVQTDDYRNPPAPRQVNARAKGFIDLDQIDVSPGQDAAYSMVQGA
jgi:hypothetical protein